MIEQFEKELNEIEFVPENISKIEELIENYRMEFVNLNNEEKKYYKIKLSEHLKKLRNIYPIQLLNEDDNRLNTILTITNEAKEIAVSVAEKINSQTTQLENTNDTLHSVDGEVKTSYKILNRMVRRIASNKYMWVLLLLILIGIIVIIILKTK